MYNPLVRESDCKIGVVPDPMATIFIDGQSDCIRHNALTSGQRPVISCEWQPPEDIPEESPPVEYPPGAPEEEPFVPETEPPPPPEEIPRETKSLNNDKFFRLLPGRNNNINQEVNNYVRG